MLLTPEGCHSCPNIHALGALQSSLWTPQHLDSPILRMQPPVPAHAEPCGLVAHGWSLNMTTVWSHLRAWVSLCEGSGIRCVFHLCSMCLVEPSCKNGSNMRYSTCVPHCVRWRACGRSWARCCLLSCTRCSVARLSCVSPTRRPR